MSSVFQNFPKKFYGQSKFSCRTCAKSYDFKKSSHKILTCEKNCDKITKLSELGCFCFGYAYIVLENRVGGKTPREFESLLLRQS